MGRNDRLFGSLEWLNISLLNKILHCIWAVRKSTAPDYAASGQRLRTFSFYICV